MNIFILVTTILGWTILAASAIFAVYIFTKLYKGRDKEASAARKQKEEALKKDKAAKVKTEKKKPSRIIDTVSGNKELKSRLEASKAQAPKREDVLSRVAQTTRTLDENPEIAAERAKVKSFLDDDIDEFDFARRKAANPNEDPRGNGGFPPPPPRL